MLNPKQLGLSGGILWALIIFLSTISAAQTGYLFDFVSSITNIYPWFTISFPGAFIGLIWGFIDAFIGFYLLAWLYNALEPKKKK